jgi:hypothetical protein
MTATMLGGSVRFQGLFIASILCIATAWCNASAASAAERKRSVTLHAFGSYQDYAMTDVNEAMRAALSVYPGATANKNKIESEAGFGGGLRIWPADRFFTSLEFQRLLASNSGSGTYAGSTYTVDLQVPATSIVAGIGYVLLGHQRLRFAMSGGAGYYVCTGELVTRGPGVNDRSDLEGSGFGFHGIGLIFARLARRLDVEIGGGYRYAKTTDVTSGGNRIRNADGSLAQIDWSGITGRAGFSFRVSRE